MSLLGTISLLCISAYPLVTVALVVPLVAGWVVIIKLDGEIVKRGGKPLVPPTKGTR